MFAEIASKPPIFFEPASSHARETLTLDFENSPHLERHYLEWISRLPSLDAKTILTTLSHYLKSEVFNAALPHKAEILRSLRAHALPLDDFVVHKIGVCRHFCLAAYYFLEKLNRERLIQIHAIEILRKEENNRRHAWLNVEFEDGSFHFDPYWGILIEKDQEIL